MKIKILLPEPLATKVAITLLHKDYEAYIGSNAYIDENGNIVNPPIEKNDTIYIVSSTIAKRLIGRKDVFHLSDEADGSCIKYLRLML